MTRAMPVREMGLIRKEIVLFRSGDGAIESQSQYDL